MNATIDTINTIDGPFTILTDSAHRVLSSGWTDSVEQIVARLAPARRPDHIDTGTTRASDAVRAYYDGDVHAIDDITVQQQGTALQQAGWAALRDITPGEPLTYTEFAVRLGNPNAVRAAASICARNAPALFVPCHRVLRADGTMGGFAWGAEVKQSLLAREYSLRGGRHG